MKLTERQTALADALRSAKAAANDARGTDDGGSANLDQPFLHGRAGLTGASVRKAAEVAGVSVSGRYISSLWNGWFVHVCQGQGFMRTRMAEAAAKALQDAGEEASVYYQLD